MYLEGTEEASVFVHVAVNDITGKVGMLKRSKTEFSDFETNSHSALIVSKDYEQRCSVASSDSGFFYWY